MRGELLAELLLHAPAAVVVEHRDVFPWVTGDPFDSAITLMTFPALRGWLEAGYTRVSTIEDFDVYLRRE